MEQPVSDPQTSQAEVLRDGAHIALLIIKLKTITYYLSVTKGDILPADKEMEDNTHYSQETRLKKRTSCRPALQCPCIVPPMGGKPIPRRCWKGAESLVWYQEMEQEKTFRRAEGLVVKAT